MREFITAEMLVLVPYTTQLYSTSSSRIDVDDADSNSVTDDDLAEYIEVWRSLKGDTGEWPLQGASVTEQKRRLLMIAMREMESQVCTNAYFRGRLDFSIDLSVYRRGLGKLLGEVPNVTETERLRALGRLPGLRLEGNAEALLALARGEATFAGWRVAMGQALQEIDSLDPSDPDFHDRAQSAFRDKMYDAVANLGKAAKSAKWRGNVQNVIEDLGVGAVTSSVAIGLAAVLGGPVTWFGSAGVGAGVAARSVYVYARGRGARRQGSAVKTLYDELTRAARAHGVALSDGIVKRQRAAFLVGTFELE